MGLYGNDFWFVCLFEWAPEVINRYDNPQKWVVPWFGVQSEAKNNFTDLLHDSNVFGMWYGGGKG